MNRFFVILKTAITLTFCIGMLLPLSAQTFNKQRTYRLMQNNFKEKMKMDEEEMRERLEQLQENPHQALTQEQTHELHELRTRSADERISESAETESEIHAAVNPTDTNNIIVAAMKFNSSNILAALSFPIYYTKDFGSTWKLSTFDGANDLPGLTIIAGGGDPIIVFDDSGAAYLSWITLTIGLDLKIKAEMHWAISDDGGATWKRQSTLIDDGEITDLTGTSGRLPDKEWMASDLSSSPYKGNVYIAYTYLNSADTTYNVYVKTKNKNSNVFSSKVNVKPNNIVFAQFTNIDVDATGTVHLLFSGATEEDSVLSLYHCKSTDGGASFSTPVRISSLHLQCFPPGTGDTCYVVGIDPNRMYPCPQLRVDKSGGIHSGNLYVTWTADGINEQKTEGLDVYYSKSEDNGKTWTDPIVVNDNTDSKTQQFFASLAVNDEGTLVITWYDRRGDQNNLMTNYYMTISRDGGNTFEPDFAVSSAAADFSKIGESNANFGVGEYTQVVTTHGYALPFWADGRTNDGNIEIYTSLLPIGQDQTTGVHDVIAISSPLNIKNIYPNPVSDIATLDLQLQKPMELQVKLFSTDGKIVRVYPDRNLSSGGHRLKLDVRGLAAGQYWVALRSDNEVKTKAIVIE